MAAAAGDDAEAVAEAAAAAEAEVEDEAVEDVLDVAPRDEEDEPADASLLSDDVEVEPSVSTVEYGYLH